MKRFVTLSMTALVAMITSVSLAGADAVRGG